MNEQTFEPVFWWIHTQEGIAVGRIVQAEDNRYCVELGVTTYKGADRTSATLFGSRRQAKEWAAARVPYRISDLRVEPPGTGIPYSALRDR